MAKSRENEQLGTYLVREGVIDREQLAVALERQARLRPPQTAMALKLGLLTTDQAMGCLQRCAAGGGPFLDVALKLGLLTPDRAVEVEQACDAAAPLAEVVSRLFGVPRATIERARAAELMGRASVGRQG